LFAGWGDEDWPVEQLATALENSPPTELAERIKVRVAASFLAKEDAKSALVHVRPLMLNAKSEMSPEARYLVGEALIQQKDWNKAIEALLPFRDQDPLRS